VSRSAHPSTSRKPREPKTTPDSYLSVTAALSTWGKPDGLTGYTANRISDEVVHDVQRAAQHRLDVLHELMAEKGVEKTTRSMRDQADAEAWRRLKWAQAIVDDPTLARADLAKQRYIPPRDPDTGQVYELGAAALGSLGHDTCEQWAITGRRPTDPHPEVAPFMDAYDEFLQAHQPEVIAAEATCIHRELGYAGRLDTIMRMHFDQASGRVPVLCDFKFKREDVKVYGGVEEETTPFGTAGLQVTAYEMATDIIHWADSVRVKNMTRKGGMWYEVDPAEYHAAIPMIPVAGAIVLQITPKRCTPHPVYITPWMREVWRHILASARDYYSPAMRKIIGPAMGPPHRPDLTQPDLTSRLEASLEPTSQGGRHLRAIDTTGDEATPTR
jgi:hypothetical protein